MEQNNTHQIKYFTSFLWRTMQYERAQEIWESETKSGAPRCKTYRPSPQYQGEKTEVVRTTDQQRLSRHPLGERFLKNNFNSQSGTRGRELYLFWCSQLLYLQVVLLYCSSRSAFKSHNHSLFWWMSAPIATTRQTLKKKRIESPVFVASLSHHGGQGKC